MNLEKLIKIVSLFCFVGWTALCLSAATGFMKVTVWEYCFVTGILAFENLLELVR